jgi:hypothetical protein
MYFMSLHGVAMDLSAGLKPRGCEVIVNSRPLEPEKHFRTGSEEAVRKRCFPGSADVSPTSRAGREPALPGEEACGSVFGHLDSLDSDRYDGKNRKNLHYRTRIQVRGRE